MTAAFDYDLADLKAQFKLSDDVCLRLEVYVGLLRRWQARVNLVSTASLDDVWRRHIADCVQLLAHAPPGAIRWADLGSGAGLPGLVIALCVMDHAGEQASVDLYESTGKKCAFLAEAIQATGAPARVVQKRIEEVAREEAALEYDVVTARALAPLEKLLTLATPFLSTGAAGLFLKGQHVDEELTQATKYWKIRARKQPSLTDPRGSVLIVDHAERKRAKDV